MTSTHRFDQQIVSRLILGFYPADDDDGDLVHGPGGPRASGVLQAGHMARFLAREALTRYRITQALGDAKSAAGSVTVIGQQLRQDFDDWCGTRPPIWPIPRRRIPQAMDVLTFAAHLQELALQDGPLQSAYQSVADAGFERGIAMLADSARAVPPPQRAAA